MKEEKDIKRIVRITIEGEQFGEPMIFQDVILFNGVVVTDGNDDLQVEGIGFWEDQPEVVIAALAAMAAISEDLMKSIEDEIDLEAVLEILETARNDIDNFRNRPRM